MAEVREEGELGASVEEVWKLVGDFGGFIEAMGLPVTMEGEGIGQTRSIPMGAEPTVERLEARDEDAKRLVYSIVSGSLPVASYVSTMQLSPAGAGRTKIEWSSTFEPVGDAAAANAVVESIYKGGIAAMQGRFGA